ncbi:hypothetical protein F503_08880 [Ophiostoma piceae UAMH 11346]|uniref:Uncharacterized protein n=1 Tax=Ophiostoma piceae (strain UAMH 11346) TaxID=1262450 RepID=S3C9U7_OPHP1|nr:hypothetical protein F503_08880 [Ophiostoma piceae UAMH 11346]
MLQAAVNCRRCLAWGDPTCNSPSSADDITRHALTCLNQPYKDARERNIGGSSMAPKTRRSRGGGRGSGNGQPVLTSTPGTAPEANTAEAGPSSGRVYRSGQAPQNQQIRFPNRRRVVKRYGRTDTARSPMQRTLTQIGYAMPPLTDLHEPDSLDTDSHAEDLDSMAQGKSFSGTASTSSAAAPRGSKRRKTAQAAQETAHPSSSFHTQTLTQFVAKNTGTGGRDEAGDDDDNYGFGATIRDSEDEFSLESPIAKPGASDNVPAGKGLTATPTKPRHEGQIGPNSSQLVFSTPKAKRTEIPSSQPSPFTPLLLLGRYHSPLGTQRSSPLSSKGNGPALPLLDMDLNPFNGARPGLTSKYPKRVIPDSFSTTNSASQGKTPLRVLGPREIIERSAPHDNSELGRAIIEASPSLSTRGMGSAASITARPRSGVSGNLAGRSSQEIPDSDDEEGGISGPYHTERNAASPTKPGNGASDGPVIDTTSTALASALSSPSISVPSSPTPLHRSRDEAIEKTIVPLHHVVDYDEASLEERDAENPSNGNQLCSSQADDTQMYSQAVESQRVPLETIRSLGPQTYESDIIISIHPEQVRKIVSGIKDHEFRGYRIPGTVTRLWIYTTQPVCELRYMAAIDPGFRKPGEIDSDSGLGNAEFNAGRLVAKFAYKIQQVYQLNNPVSLDLMKQNGWVDGPPQRYAFVPPAVVGALLGNLQRALLHNKGAENELSVSQEIEAQLLSDIADTQSSQRERTLATAALLDSSIAGKVLDSSPPQGVTQRILPPDGEAQQSMPQPSESSSTHDTRPGGSSDLSADRTGERGPIWPSQATTATSPVTEEEEPAKEKTGMAVIRESQSPYVSSPIDQGAVVPRPEVDLGPSSISSAKDEFEEDDGPRERRRPGVGRPYESQNSQQSPQLPQMARGPQTRRLRRQRSALRNARVSSTESTQIILPDSLYEEVRQAPPAVILDSEDSDEG